MYITFVHGSNKAITRHDLWLVMDRLSHNIT